MLLDNLSYINTAILIMKSWSYESIPTTIWRSVDLFYSVMNNIEVTELVKISELFAQNVILIERARGL
jgi:hypothetical protein